MTFIEKYENYEKLRRSNRNYMVCRRYIQKEYNNSTTSGRTMNEVISLNIIERQIGTDNFFSEISQKHRLQNVLFIGCDFNVSNVSMPKAKLSIELYSIWSLVLGCCCFSTWISFTVSLIISKCYLDNGPKQRNDTLL